MLNASPSGCLTQFLMRMWTFILPESTVDAMLVQEVFKQISTHMSWICHCCHHDLYSEQCIVCDSCLLWFRFNCVGLVRLPKGKNIDTMSIYGKK